MFLVWLGFSYAFGEDRAECHSDGSSLSQELENIQTVLCEEQKETLKKDPCAFLKEMYEFLGTNIILLEFDQMIKTFPEEQEKITKNLEKTLGKSLETIRKEQKAFLDKIACLKHASQLQEMLQRRTEILLKVKEVALTAAPFPYEHLFRTEGDLISDPDFRNMAQEYYEMISQKNAQAIEKGGKILALLKEYDEESQERLNLQTYFEDFTFRSRLNDLTEGKAHEGITQTLLEILEKHSNMKRVKEYQDYQVQYKAWKEKYPTLTKKTVDSMMTEQPKRPQLSTLEVDRIESFTKSYNDFINLIQKDSFSEMKGKEAFKNLSQVWAKLEVIDDGPEPLQLGSVAPSLEAFTIAMDSFRKHIMVLGSFAPGIAMAPSAPVLTGGAALFTLAHFFSQRKDKNISNELSTEDLQAIGLQWSTALLGGAAFNALGCIAQKLVAIGLTGLGAEETLNHLKKDEYYSAAVSGTGTLLIAKASTKGASKIEPENPIPDYLPEVLPKRAPGVPRSGFEWSRNHNGGVGEEGIFSPSSASSPGRGDGGLALALRPKFKTQIKPSMVLLETQPQVKSLAARENAAIQEPSLKQKTLLLSPWLGEKPPDDEEYVYILTYSNPEKTEMIGIRRVAKGNLPPLKATEVIIDHPMNASSSGAQNSGGTPYHPTNTIFSANMKHLFDDIDKLKDKKKPFSIAVATDHPEVASNAPYLVYDQWNRKENHEALIIENATTPEEASLRLADAIHRLRDFPQDQKDRLEEEVLEGSITFFDALQRISDHTKRNGQKLLLVWKDGDPLEQKPDMQEFHRQLLDTSTHVVAFYPSLTNLSHFDPKKRVRLFEIQQKGSLLDELEPEKKPARNGNGNGHTNGAEFELEYSPKAQDTLAKMEQDGSMARILKDTKKALGFLSSYGPQYGSLKTHRIKNYALGENTWESYAQTNTSNAWRILWEYKDQPTQEKKLVILDIVPHSEIDKLPHR